MQNKHISQYSNIDDIFSLDLISSGATQTANEANYFDELFSKKVQLFDDAMFFKEYRTILTHNSLVPSDLTRVIKNINENSSYFESFQFNKLSQKDELIELVNKEISSLESLIQQHKSKINVILHNLATNFEFLNL